MSKFLSVNWDDITAGVATALVVALGAVLISVKGFLDQCGLSCVDWSVAVNSGASAFIGILIAKFFSNSDGKFGRAEK